MSKRLERVVRPEVTLSVPVKEAEEEIVWLFTKPEVMAPKVTLPALIAVAKRLVDDAVVAKKLVVVAEVPVAFTKVKFWRVDEALARRLVKLPRPVAVILPVLKTVA